ncbi:MAG: hypothetical protein R2825_20280 [Saprospiraceae bacterium]
MVVQPECSNAEDIVGRPIQTDPDMGRGDGDLPGDKGLFGK